jgi:hypothetical protein
MTIARELGLGHVLRRCPNYEPRWLNDAMIRGIQTIREHMIRQHGFRRADIMGCTDENLFQIHDRLHDTERWREQKRMYRAEKRLDSIFGKEGV